MNEAQWVMWTGLLLMFIVLMPGGPGPGGRYAGT